MTGPEKKKLVSIIIPIYNGERYIEETIRNVLNQTYTELEVLCIIDGTTDESANIIRRLGDDRVKIVMQENSGATRTRNRGLSMATGEFILFLDQDDVIKPEFIELTVREIIRTNGSGWRLTDTLSTRMAGSFVGCTGSINRS